MALPNTKPKIGFSIDSIVGNRLPEAPISFSSNSNDSRSLESHSSLSDAYNHTELHMQPFTSMEKMLNDEINARKRLKIKTKETNVSVNHCRQSGTDSPKMKMSESSSISAKQPHRNAEPTTFNTKQINSDRNELRSPTSPASETEKHSVNKLRSPSPASTSNHNNNHGPIVVPAISASLMRPLPVAVNPPRSNDIKNLPPYMNASDMITSHPHSHFLAAQFQMAAALANGQVNQGYHAGGMTHLTHPHMPRDVYPLYPWLLNRHARIFPHRFPGSFLLQPFRKPKRVRTAFSPSQLLKLEHAFENNHYVVGAERKTLAQNLSLSETQVKVWFQNRRTKHKRMQQEEDAKSSNSNGGNSTSNTSNSNNNNNFDSSHISYDEDEDELIDMEMDDNDDCPSDEGSFAERMMRHHYRHQ